MHFLPSTPLPLPTCPPRGAVRAAAFAGLALALLAPAAGAVRTVREVAVTFDDIPGSATVHGTCDAQAALAFTDRLLAALAREQVTATGFVVGGSLCETLREMLLPEVLARWRAAGHLLGNHGFSHWDLNRTAIDDYLADLARGEAAMGAYLPTSESGQRYFRAPLLHTGDTPEKQAKLAGWLREHGYRTGIVTIDNQEWVFASHYARAKRSGDAARMRRIVEAYLAHLDAAFAFFEAESVALFGRETPQVLLLHANEINADELDRVMATIRGRGYRTISLDRALADPAYAAPDGYVGRRGLSWIHRYSLREGRRPGAEPREPDWLATP